MRFLFLLLALAPLFALADDRLVAECGGRTYLHRIYFVGGSPPTPNSFRYERRMFFGDTLQEGFSVQLDEADLFARKFTFTSIEGGIIFAVTASTQPKHLRGQPGRQGSAFHYRRPGSGPNDYVNNCWIDFELAKTLPARLGGN